MIQQGIINLHKPQGMTSHDCVNRMRRLTGVRRIGHTGTLDPMATGVLPLCIGPAARIAEYLDMDLKKYACSMVLGLQTDTLDVWGRVLSDDREALMRERKLPDAITPERIRSTSNEFLGLVDQTPPQYSALKLRGKKLYEYARAGETIDIPPRKIFIKDITITEWDPASLRISFEAVCSKGTYIRSLCADLADRLGTTAAMSALVRLESGAFTLNHAVTLEELEAAGQDLTRYLLPTDFPLTRFGEFRVREDRALRFLSGGALRLSEGRVLREPAYKEEEPPFPIREEYRRAYCVTAETGGGRRFLGVAFYRADTGALAPDKILIRRLEDEDF